MNIDVSNAPLWCTVCRRFLPTDQRAVGTLFDTLLKRRGQPLAGRRFVPAGKGIANGSWLRDVAHVNGVAAKERAPVPHEGVCAQFAPSARAPNTVTRENGMEDRLRDRLLAL